MMQSKELPRQFKSWTQFYDFILKEIPNHDCKGKVTFNDNGESFDFSIAEIKINACDELMESRFKISEARRIEPAIRRSLEYSFGDTIMEKVYKTCIRD